MKLYIGTQMVLPVLGSLRLRKHRTEAAATLTATLYAAAADTYFQQLRLALGDSVRLLDETGGTVFLGSVHDLRRTPEQIQLTAYDAGICLIRNELRGVFCGSPADIVAQVAERLALPLGTVETGNGRQCITARSGKSAFSILRQAVGTEREISVRNGKLSVTKSAYTVYILEPSQILAVEGQVSLEKMVNRCEVVDRTGRLLASAELSGELATYGQMQTVLGEDGSDPAQQAHATLSGRAMTGTVTVLGNPSYLCGCAAELHRPDWGLDGVYAVTAAEHRWERGFYTTTMDLEFVR